MTKSLHTLITLAVQLKLQDHLKFEDFLKGIATDYPTIFNEYAAWLNMAQSQSPSQRMVSLTASAPYSKMKLVSVGEKTDNLLRIMKKHAGISDIAL